MNKSDPLYKFMDGYDKANPSSHSWWPVLENAVRLYNRAHRSSYNPVDVVHKYLKIRSVV